MRKRTTTPRGGLEGEALASSLEVDILQRARTRLERGWTQRVGARDHNDHPVFPRDPQAQKWCLLGALDAASAEILQAHVLRARLRLLEQLQMLLGYSQTILEWHDAPQRTHHDILEHVDRLTDHFLSTLGQEP